MSYRLIEEGILWCIMQLMTERKKKHVEKVITPSENSSVDKVHRAGKPLYLYIPADLEVALRSRLKTSRRTKTEEVTIALEEYLAKHGEWPLPTNGR